MSEHEVHDVAFKGADGVISDKDATAFFLVIEKAWNVHLDRERVRNGLWKDYPAEDQVNQIKVKTDRVIRSLERLSSLGEGDTLIPELRENILEELHDIINYANFAARQV